MRWIKITASLVKSFALLFYYYCIPNLSIEHWAMWLNILEAHSVHLLKFVFQFQKWYLHPFVRVIHFCSGRWDGFVYGVWVTQDIVCMMLWVIIIRWCVDVLKLNSHDFDTVSVSNFQINFGIIKTPRTLKLLKIGMSNGRRERNEMKNLNWAQTKEEDKRKLTSKEKNEINSKGIIYKLCVWINCCIQNSEPLAIELLEHWMLNVELNMAWITFWHIKLLSNNIDH